MPPMFSLTPRSTRIASLDDASSDPRRNGRASRRTTPRCRPRSPRGDDRPGPCAWTSRHRRIPSSGEAIPSHGANHPPRESVGQGGSISGSFGMVGRSLRGMLDVRRVAPHQAYLADRVPRSCEPFVVVEILEHRDRRLAPPASICAVTPSGWVAERSWNRASRARISRRRSPIPVLASSPSSSAARARSRSPACVAAVPSSTRTSIRPGSSSSMSPAARSSNVLAARISPRAIARRRRSRGVGRLRRRAHGLARRPARGRNESIRLFEVIREDLLELGDALAGGPFQPSRMTLVQLGSRPLGSARRRRPGSVRGGIGTLRSHRTGPAPVRSGRDAAKTSGAGRRRPGRDRPRVR